MFCTTHGFDCPCILQRAFYNELLFVSLFFKSIVLVVHVLYNVPAELLFVGLFSKSIALVVHVLYNVPAELLLVSLFFKSVAVVVHVLYNVPAELLFVSLFVFQIHSFGCPCIIQCICRIFVGSPQPPPLLVAAVSFLVLGCNV